jgi:hypothetical protein
VNDITKAIDVKEPTRKLIICENDKRKSAFENPGGNVPGSIGI